MPVELYLFQGSAPCTFVQMVAKHIGVEFTLKELDFLKREHEAPEFTKVNPFQKVPTINDSGFILYESSAIAYYLVNKYAPTSELYPKDVQKRARVDQVLSVVSTHIQPKFSAFSIPSFRTNKKPSAESFKEFEEGVVKAFQEVIGDKATFVACDQLTLADIRLISLLACIVPLKDLFDRAKYPNVAAYYDRVTAKMPYFEELLRHHIDERSRFWSTLQ
ncbi:glutathione S-transferase 1-like [Dermacentor andersoni]|uniref:glutathione S-transferase 1-like n=1 Tax=Dermacentor andersoni TaxID=34620 RepID=UPI003B3A2314